MTIEHPLFMQARDYPARLARLLVAAMATEGVIDKATTGFAVTERGLGPNFTVDVAEGFAVIDGDDAPDQGSYLVRSTATESLAIDPAPVAANTSRIDLVVLRIKDPTEGGPIGDLAELDVVTGVEVVAPAVPAVPATPDSAIALAKITVTNLSASIANAAIVDLRTQSRPRPEVDLSLYLTAATAAATYATPAAIAATYLTIANAAATYLTQANAAATYLTIAAAAAAYLPKSLADAAGDLLVASANDAWARLAHPGVVGKVLKSAAAGALSWEDDSVGGGSTLSKVGVYATAATSVPNTTYTPILWGGEIHDSDAFHSTVTNTSRFTVPVGLGGKYLVIGAVSISGAAGGSARSVRARVNGSTYDRSANGIVSASAQAIIVAFVVTLAAGDYLELVGYQDSGGAINYANGGATYDSFVDVIRIGA